MTAPQIDPFEGANKAPAVSWKDKPVGTVITMTVTDHPKLVQSRDFKTKEPATWPDGNPMMSVVINGDINGEPHGLWASKPSALFVALAEAQKASGKKITPGDTLAVKFTGTKPTQGDPQKLFAVKHTPGTPSPAPADDPWASHESAPPW
jgi:hypothetical protein